MNQQVLIATLGSEPQVVTLALDLLREKGHPIGEVIVVHTAGEAVQAALKVLEEEFAQPGALWLSTRSGEKARWACGGGYYERRGYCCPVPHALPSALS